MHATNYVPYTGIINIQDALTQACKLVTAIENCCSG